MAYRFKAKRVASWLTFNAVFWALTVGAFIYDSEGAKGLLTVMTVALAVISTSVWLPAMQPAQRKADEYDIPREVEFVHDMAFVVLFVWLGAFALSLAMLIILVNTQKWFDTK